MRVPIPWVLLLAIAVIGGGWWAGTRQADFLTPPSEAKLALIRQRVKSSMPPIDHPSDAVSLPAVVAEPAPPPPVDPPKPAIELGDLSRPPTLREYGDAAPKGAAYLIELAGLLEAKGENQRALLAWERVLDTAQPDDHQTLLASAAILRLRPTLPDWNKDRATTLTIILHAGTHKKTARSLTPVLEDIARDLQHASAGILKVTASVTVTTTATVTATTKRGHAPPPAPVTLWLTGPTKKSPTTAVLASTADSPKALREDVLKTVCLIIHDQLAHATVRTPPVAGANAANPLDTLRARITRACWQELGTQLNRPREKKDKHE